MTPEEATQLYNSEQRKYYDYCGYIHSYENKIADIVLNIRTNVY